MALFTIQRKKLANGLTAVLLPRDEGETVTFLVLIGVGSRYESSRQSGLSHFLEHMFFKGTSKRPSAREIAESIDTVGGEFNAFTGEEYTGYYVKVATQHLAHGAEVVADILLNPLFPAAEIEKERGVIIEEIRMYTDMPMRHIWHLWQAALYGDHPLGKRIDGTEATVSAFKRRDFLSYTRKHYHGANAVVAVAGKFEVPEVNKMLAKLFKFLPQGAATKPKSAPRRVPQQSFVHEWRKSLDQTHLMVGVPGLALADDRRWAAELLATVLGSGMSSRLFHRVREQHGLAYAVRTSNDSYVDTGSFVTQAGVRTDQAPEALRLILEEYDRVMAEPIGEEELQKAKQMVRGTMLIHLEETNALALFAGVQQLLQGSIETPDAMLAKVDSVTAEDVMVLAQQLLDKRHRAVALLGPQRSTKAFVNVL